MQKKNYKGRCVKRSLSKCKGVCRTYTPLQQAYADILQNERAIAEFETNVLLEGEEYTSDFLFKNMNGDLGVRECVNRNHLTKPMVVKLLEVVCMFGTPHYTYSNSVSHIVLCSFFFA